MVGNETDRTQNEHLHFPACLVHWVTERHDQERVSTLQGGGPAQTLETGIIFLRSNTSGGKFVLAGRRCLCGWPVTRLFFNDPPGVLLRGERGCWLT